MIIANALFITGTYLTFLSFSVAKKLQLSKKLNLWQVKF